MQSFRPRGSVVSLGLEGTEPDKIRGPLGQRLRQLEGPISSGIQRLRHSEAQKLRGSHTQGFRYSEAQKLRGSDTLIL